MRRYQKYRESGLPWLPTIPANWRVLPNIAIFRERNERGFVDTELLSVTQDRGIIRQAELGEKKDSSNEDKTNYKRVQVGDIAYNKMRMWQGAVGVSEYEGIVSPAYVVIRPTRRLNPRFYQFLFKTPAYVNYSYRNSYGIHDDQLSLRYNDFKRMYSIYPDPEEQDAIVAFLDGRLAEIDCFIANKERLIGLLKEQKGAIINRAVMRGLDAGAPMKQSGIEWLGDIPAHWEVVQIKRLTPVRRGASPRPIDDPRYFDEHGRYAWVRIADVTASERYLVTTTQRLSELGSSLSVKLSTGDIFVSIAGSVGKAIITKIDCCIHDGFVYFPHIRINKEFLYYLFTGGELYKGLGKLGTQLNLNTDTVGAISIPLPPSEEMDRIVRFLDARLMEVEIAISKAEREIDLIKEYRTALIADAVTGKIDVRAAVAERVAEEVAV